MMGFTHVTLWLEDDGTNTIETRLDVTIGDRQAFLKECAKAWDRHHHDPETTYVWHLRKENDR